MITQESKKQMDMRIYVTDEQKAKMTRLLERLDGAGISLRDNRGHLSYSQLIRFSMEVLDMNIDRVIAEGQGKQE
mgnify:CR=1 FL=1